MPCPPCKIIINGGFIAPLATRLAKVSHDQVIRSAASALASAAELHNEIVIAAQARGLMKFDAYDFGGCPQAIRLHEWILRANGVEGDDEAQTSLMAEWVTMLHENITAIISGEAEKIVRGA